MTDTTTKPPRRRARTTASIHSTVQRPILGRYQSLSRCGSGGMGTVYRARDVMSGEVVAVKVIPRPDEWQRVQREIEALRSIEHPNVVRMRDFGFEDEQVVLVMDLVEGPTLGELLQIAPCVPWRTAIGLTIAVLEGLVRVHEVGLVHRDIKPSNIIVEDPDRPSVTIIDFGIVKPVDDRRRITAVGTVVGTPAYMPPEQLLGQTIGPTADVYSVGLVLLQMLTGCNPRSLGLDVLTTKMRFVPRLSLPEQDSMPERLPCIVRDMLQPMPQRRVPTVARCAQLLRHVLEHDDVPQLRAQQPSTVEVVAAESPDARIG